MTNEEREFKFTTRHLQLGEADLAFKQMRNDIDSRSNAIFDNGVIKPDYSPAPDKNDLYAHFDATQITAADGDTISTWADQTTANRDLTGDTPPIYKPSAINGNPALRFNGVDTLLNISWSNVSEPFQIFAVAQLHASSISSVHTIYDAYSSQNAQMYTSDTVPWAVWTGSGRITGGSTNNDPHIFSTFCSSSSEILRVDGSQLASGDTGGGDLDGLTVGSRSTSGGYGEYDIGEILVYPQDKTEIQSNVETYLSDKWGITV